MHVLNLDITLFKLVLVRKKFQINTIIISAGILIYLKIKKNDLKNSKNALKKCLQPLFKIA
jgi:hypothetical protein